jgi:hypothetical protein
MPSKKQTNTILIVGVVAVVGYLYYKSRLTTTAAVTSTAPNASIAPSQNIFQSLSNLISGTPAPVAASNPAGVALEQPTSAADPGNVYAPALDPTGMQLNFLN